MDRYFDSSSASIRYRIDGSGPVVVMLHGYLEDLTIWEGLVRALKESCTLLRIDLPGHGKSELPAEPVTMETMARTVNALVETQGFNRIQLIGHSMGGYTALAYAELFPQKVAGLILLHSTPNADNTAKRLARKNDTERIKSGGKQRLIEEAIPRLFAEQNMALHSEAIERIKNTALQTSDSGIIGALNGMATRPDRNHVVSNARFPVGMIFGNYDRIIGKETALAIAQRHPNARTIFLKNSGHMGFIEEPEQTLDAIKELLT